jgi:integrase/recombinase XerC
MTISFNYPTNHYPTDWLQSVHSENHTLLLPIQDNAGLEAESLRTLFAPSAGALYVYQPSKRRRVLNKAVDKLEASSLPGFEFAISYLHSKYRSNHSISSIDQTGRTLHAFLLFYKRLGRQDICQIQRQDISQYVEHEQERGLKVSSVKNHLQTVYAFVHYLVNSDVLPKELLVKKIKIKMPEMLPKAIPAEDMEKILQVISKVRDRALITLLLHTGMRIGELLKVKVTDLVQSERKILLHVGDKNLHGRIVYYNSTAEVALNEWLALRNPDNKYLFYGPRGNELSYVSAWMIMKKAVQKVGLEGKGYSLHSLRHTFATNMLNAGLRVEVLQQFLGHLSIDMTLRYARISNTTREESYFKAMAIIEKGEHYEHDRVNPELQAVFEEKKLLESHG